MSDSLSAVRAMLEAHGQAHLLAFYDQLNAKQQASLLAQISAIDFDALDELIDEYVRHPQPAKLPDKIEPAPYYALGSEERKYHEVGEEVIASGKIAAFTVAGGQGTRLGWNGPKGTFPATPITGKPLFRVFAEQILAAQRRYGVTIPWYIMTSPINDADTRAFMTDNNCFGLNRRDMFMFPQGVVPSFEMSTGRLLLAEKHEIAVNPDGHGGSLRALRQSGAIEDMAGRGIEHISYFQVDNPLAKVIDPVFIGRHTAAPDSSAELSSKMVPKASPEEKVGVFCRAGGKTLVIEYSDLPSELASQRDDRGALRFNAGSIAIHLFGVAFVERLTADPHRFGLPWHRAEKKVPFIDVETGQRIEPASPNAVKLEAFVFDALPLAESAIVCETSRAEEFAPIKNAEGADSPATSHELQSERFAKWLESRGVRVPRDRNGRAQARIEISPLTATEADEIPAADLPPVIQPGANVVL
ncbi:MAG TPA: UDPGP type 1 family protein [Phycisphaerales bacterium]|nr:UDPGP type 1 family protein [Phycisphaerales bacterium]HRQ76677.1 UDPGP type 1 family protein [Phycisphaerales bacterium]